MTVSAGAPPIRFPSPIADLPAYPSGSAASRAVRAAALRGRSAMGQVSLTRTDVRDVVSALDRGLDVQILCDHDQLLQSHLA